MELNSLKNSVFSVQLRMEFRVLYNTDQQIFFDQGLNSMYFRLCRPYHLCSKYSTLLLECKGHCWQCRNGWLWLCANKPLFTDTEIRTSYNCYVKQKSYSFFQTLKDIKTKFGLCAIEKQAEAELANPGSRTHLPDITMKQVANITLTTSCSRVWEPETSSRLVSLSSSVSQRRFWCLTSGHTACEWQCQAGAWMSWFKSYLPSPTWFQKSKFKISSTATKSFCHFSSAVHHIFFHFKGIYSNKYLKIKDSVSSSYTEN